MLFIYMVCIVITWIPIYACDCCSKPHPPYGHPSRRPAISVPAPPVIVPPPSYGPPGKPGAPGMPRCSGPPCHSSGGPVITVPTPPAVITTPPPISPCPPSYGPPNKPDAPGHGFGRGRVA
ncbi:hypothetical protein RND81_13G048500 [Saponaria officinalis]|uniref:Uncharacterized protein n=1 Tax=Saponaria officinalis TaxID=3572 RepID=A0AAW1GU39_SAPOF